MTTLYRTPNVVLAGAEWHCAVKFRNGRARRHFRFRLSGRYMWLPITSWKGNLPKAKEFNNAFQTFKPHMLRAERSVVANAERLGRAA